RQHCHPSFDRQEEMMATANSPQGSSLEKRALLGLLIGAGVGAAIGIPLESVGLGVGIGAGLGILFASAGGMRGDSGDGGGNRKLTHLAAKN
ncbi:MAG: hypothetical protein ACI8PQ_002758, partial [Planctomycetota bacterium]